MSDELEPTRGTNPQPPMGPVPTGKFCGSCGAPLVATAVICPSCGTSVGALKSKTVAVLLAVFLSFWTWIYTYKKDAVKFWIGLVAGLGLGFLTMGITAVIVWVWAIIDVAVKPESFYQQYPR